MRPFVDSPEPRRRARKRFLLRTTLSVLISALIVVTYPLVWALGYQDHRWHWHTAADIVAFLAVIVSTLIYTLRDVPNPPLSSGFARLAVVVSYAALLSAMFWDWAGRPSDSDVLGGPGFFLMPLVAAAAAWAVAALASAAIRRWVASSTKV